MILQKFLKLQVDTPFKKLLPIVLMLALQIWVAIPGYEVIDRGAAVPNVTLHSTPEEWAKVLYNADAGGYLGIAYALVSGHGFSRYCPTCTPPDFYPNDFWGPGAPYSFAAALKVGELFGDHTMQPIFFYAVFSHCLSALLLLFTFWLFSKNFLASLLAAALLGFSPALQNLSYSWLLTSSETVNFVPLAFMFYFMARCFKSFWNDEKPSRNLFALAGFSLGIVAIVRDSNFPFTYFAVLAFCLQVYLRQPKRIKQAAIMSLVFFFSAYAPRAATQIWNKNRTGMAIVGRSGFGGDVAGYFYSKCDTEPGFGDSNGLNLGDCIDPEAGKYVREELIPKGLARRSRIFWVLFKSIVTHPIAAITFKAQRAPVLFIGTDRWPNVQMTFASYWTGALYLVFFLYLIYTVFIKRRWPPEVVYIYFGFIVCAFSLIHAEFRYSFPALMIIQIVPALFLASLLEDKLKTKT